MELLKRSKVLIFVALLIASFAIGILVGKGKQEKEIRNIQIDGVWKAQNIEVGTSKELGKVYYFVFDKDGNLYTIDDDEIKRGNYADTDVKDEFTLQIEDGAISTCTYDKDIIKCEIYGTLEKIK